MSSSDGIRLTPQLTMVFFTRSPWPRVASSVWAQDRIDGQDDSGFRLKKEVLGDGGRGGGGLSHGGGHELHKYQGCHNFSTYQISSY